jgi:hypothetical protein
MKPPRKTPTTAMVKKVMLEAGGRCPWCPSGTRLTFAEASIHHIDGEPSNSVIENLILACHNHHGKIEGNLIPEWEVKFKKMCLSNPGTLERLGLQPLQGVREIKGKRPKARKVAVSGDNSGIVADTIMNSGTMAGTVKFTGPSKTPVQVVGSLVTRADNYGYVEYLIKRLSRYRAWRPGGGGSPDNPGAVRKIFEREMGRLPKDFPLARFEDAVQYLFGKLHKTALGKIGKANVSSFSEWRLKGLDYRRFLLLRDEGAGGEEAGLAEATRVSRRSSTRAGRAPLKVAARAVSWARTAWACSARVLGQGCLPAAARAGAAALGVCSSAVSRPVWVAVPAAFWNSGRSHRMRPRRRA